MIKKKEEERFNLKLNNLDKKQKQLENKFLTIERGLIKINGRENNLNLWMVFLTFFIAVSAISTFLSIRDQTEAIEGYYLTQVYLSGWHCPEKLEENIPIYFDIGIANYGKIPTKMSWWWFYQNVNITQLKNGDRNEIEREGGPFILVPIEYRNNEQFQIDQVNVELTNISYPYAKFVFSYSYSKKKKTMIESFTCEYQNKNGTFEIKKLEDNEQTLYSVGLDKIK